MRFLQKKSREDSNELMALQQEISSEIEEEKVGKGITYSHR